MTLFVPLPNRAPPSAIANCSCSLAHEPYVLIERTRSIRLLFPQITMAPVLMFFSPPAPVSAVVEISAQLASQVKSRITTLSVVVFGSDSKQLMPKCIAEAFPPSCTVVLFIPAPSRTHPDLTAQVFVIAVRNVPGPR